MEVVGYAIIKKNPVSGVSPIPIEKFTVNRVRVMEFAADGGVLVIDSEAKGFASFDKSDVLTSFKCRLAGEVVAPSDLSDGHAYVYAAKCLSRKGGYNFILSEMVIAASLHKGEFCDSFLWSKQ